jgi:hypothetical protein
MTIGRVIIHAMLSGDNSYSIDKAGFLHGVARFGLDLPVPSINKRLAMYGNTEDIISQVKKVGAEMPELNLNEEQFSMLQSQSFDQRNLKGTLAQ